MQTDFMQADTTTSASSCTHTLAHFVENFDVSILGDVESQSFAMYAAECTLKIIVSLAAGLTRHLYIFTAALDFMLAIIAPADQGGDIATEVVITLSFCSRFCSLLIRCRCEAPNSKHVHPREVQ